MRVYIALFILPNDYILVNKFIRFRALELCHEAATPGGLNEQTLKKMRDRGHYTLVQEGLQDILNRLRK